MRAKIAKLHGFCVLLNLISHFFANCKILSEIRKLVFPFNQAGTFPFGRYTIAFIFHSHMLMIIQ